jgi:tRNA(Ile2) C34 agmatinyltransferase TiaS
MIYELVGLQVFSGYINWDQGILYSSDASKLRELTQCKNCGGEIQLVGKGVVKCKFCGTEYFLT